MDEITIQVDDDCFGTEGHQFADWLDAYGFDVTRVPNVGGCHPEHPRLDAMWENFCNWRNAEPRGTDGFFTFKAGR